MGRIRNAIKYTEVMFEMKFGKKTLIYTKVYGVGNGTHKPIKVKHHDTVPTPLGKAKPSVL